MKPLKIDDLIELLQKLREEHGNLRVALVGRYRDISSLYDSDLTVGCLTVGYDDCMEFKDCGDIGDPEREYDIVLGIRKD